MLNEKFFFFFFFFKKKKKKKKKKYQLPMIHAIPEVEIEANELLSRMSDGRMSLRLETQREKVTGGVAETLDIVISDELGARAYEMYSGGEAFPPISRCASPSASCWRAGPGGVTCKPSSSTKALAHRTNRARAPCRGDQLDPARLRAHPRHHPHRREAQGPLPRRASTSSETARGSQISIA